MFLPGHLKRLNIVGSLRDREVACSASEYRGTNFKLCVWRAMSSHSSHHPQEVILTQLSLHVHKGGLKSYSFHFSGSSWEGRGNSGVAKDACLESLRSLVLNPALAFKFQTNKASLPCPLVKNSILWGADVTER